jgi:hypothetical protein
MSSVSQKFVLVGPHAGKSLILNNSHEFVDGEYVFQGSADQAATLTRIFSFYGAVPAEQARAMELEAMLGLSDADVQAPSPQLHALAEDVEKTLTEQKEPEATSERAGLGQPDLGLAIGALNPEADGDWTSNNLPSLDRLAELMGKKPSRDEVEAIATGYTRAKARAARG